MQLTRTITTAVLTSAIYTTMYATEPNTTDSISEIPEFATQQPAYTVPIENTVITQPATSRYIPTFMLGRPLFKAEQKQLTISHISYNQPAPAIYWDTGYATAFKTTDYLYGLIGIESGSFCVTQRFGNVTISASLSAIHYGLFRNVTNQFGLGGSATWYISDHISLTVFGSVYNRNPYYSPAAIPYVATSNFGGYATVKATDNLGIDLGVRREYNSATGHWESVPIVAPYIDIGGKHRIQIDAGYLLKNAIFGSQQSASPVIGPPKFDIPIAPRE